MADKPQEQLTVEEKTLKAKELYGQGCRNYYVKSYSEAADQLSDACELYGQVFGVDGDELGEVYLLYAKALIAVEQEENKLVDIPEDEEESENDDEETESDTNEAEDKPKDPEEKLDDKPKDPEEKMETESDEKPKEAEADSKDAEKDLKNAETEKALSNGHHEGEAKEPEAGPSDEKKEDEEAGNLEVAWEVLQNAAQIFQRQNEKGLSNLVDVYMEMARISIENENFAIALEDYGRALATFEKIEEAEKNHRIAAEVHYRIGLCQTLEKTYDESIKSFQKAHDVLSDVIEKEKLKEQTDDIAAKIKDMEETKQEILNKINETGDVKEDEVEKIKKELAKFYNKMNGSGDSAKESSDSATDISHLVKRKKPDVNDSKVESSPAKKQAIEAEDAVKAVPADDEKKKIEEEESVQPSIEN